MHQILRYLKKTPGNGLFFRKNEQQSIKAYTDVDWLGALDDNKSTLGYSTMVWGNLMIWRSKKQFVVAQSSVEAELRALA